ncbi:MAG: hypothetical protein KIT46_03770 [Anaerolineales bacterium]|nr:hypothetical protein [Anaerolineales bacterium]MCW5855144.1 hypothetical protein [Anaerolineales bacterium]
MSDTVCLSCDGKISVKNTPKIGARVQCPACDAEFEVVWLSPLQLDWPVDDFEDEYDDAGYDED